MTDAFWVFLFVLMALAVFTRETFVFILFYFFAGALLIGRWWSGRVVNRITFTRRYDRHAFPGEVIPVRLDVKNESLLPAIWLNVQDLSPLDVTESGSFQQVISLGPREKTRLQYELRARKRGYYTIGPLQLASGDLLGLSPERQSQGGLDHLTVFPRVIALRKVILPSRSPMGTLRHTQPIFEDPSRPMGKRNYQAGDSMRRIDWKATASTGRLQTRLFEPSIALETTLFLNMNQNDYHQRTRFDATELAVITTASLANWIISQRQSTGLIAHGLDPLSPDSLPVPLKASKGRAHLIRILEILARIRSVETTPFPALIRQQRVDLPWGTTIIIITGSTDQTLLDELSMAQRAGLNPVLILCGEHPNHRQSEQQMKRLHIPVFVLRTEQDLDVWRF